MPIGNGAAVAWNDIIIPVSNLRPGASAPVFAVFTNGIYGLRFDAGVMDEVHGAFELLHDYVEGTDLHVHVHWSPTTNNNGNAVFSLEYTVANFGSTFPASAPLIGPPTPAGGIVNRHLIYSIGVIPGAGLKIGSMVAFRLYRPNGGLDTFTGNAFVHSFGVHYQTDGLGSRLIAAK